MSRDVGGWAVPSSQSKNEDRAGLQQPALTGLADSPGGIAHNYTILQFVLEFSHAISFCTRLSSDLQFRLWTSRRGLNSCNALWAVGIVVVCRYSGKHLLVVVYIASIEIYILVSYILYQYFTTLKNSLGYLVSEHTQLQKKKKKIYII